jgi:hypothetical protein
VHNTLFSSYDSGTNPPIFPACPSGGHAGTDADPCPVSGFEYCGISNWDTDPGFAIGGDDSLGNGGFATHIRVSEMISGHIPHAIQVAADCGNGSRVFPHYSSAAACGPDATNRPPFGALFFLDYTQAQLDTLQMQLPSWQFAIIEAMTKYGGYFGDTISPGNDTPTHYPSPALWGFEGAGGYILQGGMTSSPLYDWLNTNPAFAPTTDPTNGIRTLPLACYSVPWQGGTFTGCDMAPWVMIPALTGPNCMMGTCDISQHMHIADPCVALGLAGQPGGC